MANCCDFEWESQGFKKGEAIGKLFCSKDFLELMKRDSTVGAQIAKYQESTSKEELQT